MNLDDAKALWTSDHEPTDETMSTRTLSDSEILRLVQEQSEAFDQKIRRRDLLESIAAVAVCLFFGWLAWDDPSPLVTAGSLIIIGGSALIFGRLRWARMRSADAPTDQPVTQRLQHEREKTDAQIRLLESVLWWYIAPLLVGLLLVTVGDNGWSAFTFIYGTVVLLGAGWIYVLNQRAVRRSLRPRREKLTRLLNQVSEETGM
jgi:Flp pilus assembly protein TadB